MLEDKKYPQIFGHVRKTTYLCGANINKNKCYNIPNMATKIQKKSKKYCSFGGIFHIQDVFSEILSNVIDKVLGQRGETAKAYKYSELFEALFSN